MIQIFQAVVQPLARFCLLNKGALKLIDVEKLFKVTGPKGFTTLLYRLDLDIYKIRGPHLAALFDHLWRETPAAAMRLAFQFELPLKLSDDFCTTGPNRNQNIEEEGYQSNWSLEKILHRLMISPSPSEHFLRLYFFEIASCQKF